MDFFYEHGLIGLFLAAFISATIVPFSSEAVFIFFVLKGFDVERCVIVATIGNSLGALTAYYIGYLIRWDWLTKYFRVNKVQVLKQEERIQKYGSIIGFLCWLPLVGDLIAVACGVFRTNIFLFTITMTTGKALRYLFVLKALQLVGL